jgi:hypothetical protein
MPGSSEHTGASVNIVYIESSYIQYMPEEKQDCVCLQQSCNISKRTAEKPRLPLLQWKHAYLESHCIALALI